MDNIISSDLNKLVVDNERFRHVISTSDQMQVVLMCLRPGEEIGMEKHDCVTQFFRVESGTGVLEIGPLGNDCKCKGIKKIRLHDESFAFIPAGTYHNITNVSKTNDLKLYTIYSPPHHPHGLIE